jgi:hypothetical protein
MLRFEKEKKDKSEQITSIRVKICAARQCGTYLCCVSTSSGDFAGSVECMGGKEGGNPTFTSPSQQSPMQTITVVTT